MKKVFVINGHQYYPFSEGKLNRALMDKAVNAFKTSGMEVRTTYTQEDYDVDNEIEKFKWADLVFIQSPLNWMGVSWSFKKYMDEVFSAGMMGPMSEGDGRSSDAPKKNYGMGGKLKGKYMLSFTANAPKEAFNDPQEAFLNGLSEDDLLRPVHLNFKWFGLEALPTFMAYDVMKNPDVENDFLRFNEHLEEQILKLN